MIKLVKIESGKATFFVEVEDIGPTAIVAGTSKNDFEEVAALKDLAPNLDNVTHMVVACCKSLYEAIAQIPKPEKIAMEFGVKFVGEAGIPMLTKASGEASMKISVEWKG